MKPAAAPQVPILRRIARAVAGVGAAALLAWGAWLGYDATVSLPIQRVIYAGDLDRLAQAELDALAQAVQAAPGAPIEAIRDSARRVPWVRDASVRRIFPDAVEITFSAHVAFARWNDAQLVSDEGAVFGAPDAGTTLPRLRGPEGTAPQVVAAFKEARDVLAPVGKVTELRLSPRGAWHAVLDNGLAVALGRGEWHERARRFAYAWSRLDEPARAATYADLRYPGGFALKRAATLTLPATPSQGRGKNDP